MSTLRNSFFMAGLLVATAAVQADPIIIDDESRGGFGDVSGTLSVDGTGINFFVNIDSDGNFMLEEDVEYENSDGDMLTITQVEGNVDPVQVLAIAAVDFGAASSFSVSITAPLIPSITGSASFMTDLFGSCADGAADGCGATPFLGTLLAEYFVNGMTTMLSGVGPAFSLGSPGGVYSPPGVTGTFNCASVGGCTSFTTVLSWTGTGGGDGYGFTSRYELVAIPEPGMLMLFGLGLVAIGAGRRRRS